MSSTPLSKMNKKELYEECKKLKEENVDLKESYKYGTLGKNEVHIQLNKQGDKYYCHNTAMEIKSLKEDKETLKEVLDQVGIFLVENYRRGRALEKIDKFILSRKCPEDVAYQIDKIIREIQEV